ncbi:TetR/AcrR family transcriptional regulator [Brevibacillus reuszeri]|uniref:TetR/AcrR family transcriptional regulator n=1 Tax=Brevibacillus reuszeri TaxID=54915 RepID=UPI00289B569E|nr:TetR/AcrR family transcriptional regulator [Brevibacillus reuszeri]
MTKNNQARDLIIKAATRLFHVQGYHATGLNQILVESGTPKGSLYYYFPKGKEQLVIETVQYAAALIEADIRQRVESVADPVEAIHLHLECLAEQFSDLSDPGNLKSPPFLLIALETAFSNERIRQVCSETYQKWESLFLKKLMQLDMEEQRAKNMATTVMALIEGAVTLSITQKTNAPIRAIQSIIPTLLK